MGAPALLISTELGPGGDGLAAAAAVAVATSGDAGGSRGAVLVEANARSRRRPTLLSSTAARALEERLVSVCDTPPAARGRICWAALRLGDGWPARLAELAELSGCTVVAHLPPAEWRHALDAEELAVAGGLVRADPGAHRHQLALLAGELRARGLGFRVLTRPIGLVGSRRAMAGLDAGGPVAARARRIAARLAPQAGQALPLVAGLCLLVVALATVLAALSGAVTGASREQRAADLAALSAARAMRDDLPRLTAPARLPNGLPNPAHLPRPRYLERARSAAEAAAARNGAEHAEVAFPDASEAVPLTVRVDLGGGRWAKAQASPPAASPSGPTASGDYSGPLAMRQGKPMRPDVAAAFDRLAAAARRAGHALVITSAYRSDAEQARLFAANPDPRWVAPPGTSLHRCGTELDLGPPAAYAWLAANAPRFGFVKRYSWSLPGFEKAPIHSNGGSGSSSSCSANRRSHTSRLRFGNT
jgi:hypothetical protein